MFQEMLQVGSGGGSSVKLNSVEKTYNGNISSAGNYGYLKVDYPPEFTKDTLVSAIMRSGTGAGNFMFLSTRDDGLYLYFSASSGTAKNVKLKYWYVE